MSLKLNQEFVTETQITAGLDRRQAVISKLYSDDDDDDEKEEDIQ